MTTDVTHNLPKIVADHLAASNARDVEAWMAGSTPDACWMTSPPSSPARRDPLRCMALTREASLGRTVKQSSRPVISSSRGKRD